MGYLMPYSINRPMTARKGLYAAGEITAQIMFEEIRNNGDMKNKMIAMILAGNIRVQKNGVIRVKGLGGMFNRNSYGNKIEVNQQRMLGQKNSK